MAFSLISSPSFLPKPINYIPCSLSQQNRTVKCQFRCESEQYSSDGKLARDNNNRSSSSKLGIGSPIIITEAPRMIKTAASVPCLRVNAGLVNPGDVGRIVSRKPMDVWAVRLSIGTYLIDGKYFQALEIDE